MITNNDYCLKYIESEARRKELEQILLKDLGTNGLIGREIHIQRLEEKNEKLKYEITVLRRKAEVFNKRLYATGLIVNCTGCMDGRPFDAENLTEGKVVEVERIAKRLRDWWNNNNKRI